MVFKESDVPENEVQTEQIKPQIRIEELDKLAWKIDPTDFKRAKVKKQRQLGRIELGQVAEGSLRRELYLRNREKLMNEYEIVNESHQDNGPVVVEQITPKQLAEQDADEDAEADDLSARLKASMAQPAEGALEANVGDGQKPVEEEKKDPWFEIQPKPADITKIMGDAIREKGSGLTRDEQKVAVDSWRLEQWKDKVRSETQLDSTDRMRIVRQTHMLNNHLSVEQTSSLIAEALEKARLEQAQKVINEQMGVEVEKSTTKTPEQIAEEKRRMQEGLAQITARRVAQRVEAEEATGLSDQLKESMDGNPDKGKVRLSLQYDNFIV